MICHANHMSQDTATVTWSQQNRIEASRMIISYNMLTYVDLIVYTWSLEQARYSSSMDHPVQYIRQIICTRNSIEFSCVIPIQDFLLEIQRLDFILFFSSFLFFSFLFLSVYSIFRTRIRDQWQVTGYCHTVT